MAATAPPPPTATVVLGRSRSYGVITGDDLRSYFDAKVGRPHRRS